MRVVVARNVGTHTHRVKIPFAIPIIVVKNHPCPAAYAIITLWLEEGASR